MAWYTEPWYSKYIVVALWPPRLRPNRFKPLLPLFGEIANFIDGVDEDAWKSAWTKDRHEVQTVDQKTLAMCETMLGVTDQDRVREEFGSRYASAYY